MRILGIDYGTKKIGIAIVDDQIKIASPLAILKNDDNFFAALKKFIADEAVDKIVIGKPQGTGFETESYVEEIERFVASLNDQLEIPAVTFDESFTTAEAQRLMKESRHRGEDDDLAAMVILQAYVDSVTDENI